MNRLKEPSTWAGAAAIVGTVGAVVPPQYSWVVTLLSGLAGAAAVALREKAGPP